MTVDPNVSRGKTPLEFGDSENDSVGNNSAALNSATFHLPNALTERNQWVLWRYETRDGRTTKVPYRANGKLANTTNPTTWASYEEVLAAYRRFPNRWSGIGYVFSADDPYCGIDLDDCITSTGDIKAWAQPILATFSDTYMEISPSGHGVKIWPRATLPGEGKGKKVYVDGSGNPVRVQEKSEGAIEIYDRGRYFTVTGDALNGAPLQIEDYQAEVAALYACISGDGADKPKAKVDLHTQPKFLDGQRHDYLMSVAAQFRAKGMERTEILAAVHVINQERCSPPKSHDEVEKIVDWVCKKPAGTNRRSVSKEDAADSYSHVKNGTNVAELATKITSEAYFTKDPSGQIYVFKEGFYQPSGESFINQRVKKILERWGLSQSWTSKKSKEVCEYIRVDCPELWPQPPADEINVENGLLNVKTRVLRPHDPKFLSPIQLPVRFDPAARCPFWEQFISDVFPEDSEALAWEIPAWLMTPDTSIQKAVLLSGEGANGKSVYLFGLVSFIGKRNASAISLHKLEQDKFAAARLLGKLANICPDLPSSHLAGTSTFKALTGGDVVSAERKYHDSFEYIPFSKLIFSANQPPRSDDGTHGFFRRWIVVPFNRTFEEGAKETLPRAVLDARLSDPAELSGVLNKALEALAHIRQHGLTEGESSRRAWDEFREATDPLTVWLDQNTIDDPEGVTPKFWLMDAYNRSCASAGRSGMTKTAFGLALKRARKNLKDVNRTVRNRLQGCYEGIRLLEEPSHEGPKA